MCGTDADFKPLGPVPVKENAAVGSGLLDRGMQIITKPFGVTELAAKIPEMIDG